MALRIELDWNLKITVDAALRAQGADPEVTRARRPLIVERTEAALEIARPLLEPVVLYDEFPVAGHRADSLQLDRGTLACGPWVADRLRNAERLVAGVCTIGDELEHEVMRLFEGDAVTALALDGIGTAALESLTAQACRRIQSRGRAEGLRGVVHCWPGVRDWPVEEAQPLIFGLFDPDDEIGGLVRLLPSMVMQPLKSLTLFLGLTAEAVPFEHECDICAVGTSCRYRAARARRA